MTVSQLRAATFLDKGGTGKTTTAAHLGVALAERDLKTLLIDLAGKQGDLAKHYGLWGDVQDDIERGSDWPNVGTVFQDEWPQVADHFDDAVAELVYSTGEGVDLLPAHPGLDSLDSELGNIDDAEDRYSRLDTFLTEYVWGYDAIIIDLPGLSNNVSLNGLWAGRSIVAPVEMGPFESEQTEALEADIGKLVRNFGVDVELAMVLPNKVDTRTTLGAKYLEEVRARFPDAASPAYVPVCQDIRNAAEQGKTLFALENPSKTGREALEAFRACADTLEARWREVAA